MEFDALRAVRSRFHDGWPNTVDCGEGWFDLIVELDRELNEIDPDYKIFQIKEKFGGLRFYISGSNPLLTKTLQAKIDEYEKKSYSICEVTGDPGSLMMKGHRYRTLSESYLADGWERAGSF
jgi:hypothetical protein